MLLCSTDASLRQQTPLVFNQLHWLCAEHFLMHRNQGSVPGSVISAKTNSIMQMQFQLLSEGDEWWSEMPALNGKDKREDGMGREGVSAMISYLCHILH